jgi:hypothetical protein
MSWEFVDTLLWSDYVWEWRNRPQTVRKKYTTFTTERIVALRSVNKILPESYDFAASQIAENLFVRL